MRKPKDQVQKAIPYIHRQTIIFARVKIACTGNVFMFFAVINSKDIANQQARQMNFSSRHTEGITNFSLPLPHE
jgi:hypothetical protein